jgi:hypothetical protein
MILDQIAPKSLKVIDLVPDPSDVSGSPESLSASDGIRSGASWRFRAKWNPVRVKKTHQIKNLELSPFP